MICLFRRSVASLLAATRSQKTAFARRQRMICLFRRSVASSLAATRSQKPDLRGGSA